MSRLHEIAMGCVPFLNGKWRYMETQAWAEYRQRAVLQDDSERGRQIIFSDYYRGEGRLQVAGTLPNQKYTSQTITLALSRSIPAISADINRRFLPEYLREWDKAEKIYLQDLEKLQKLRTRGNLLKQIDPSIRSAWSDNKEVATDYYLSNGKLRLSSYDDTAFLDIRLNFDQLVKVLHLLNN